MVRLTPDGSTTVYSDSFKQHYHSVFGAKTESERVYVDLGLRRAFECFSGEIAILEIGFGTGLNAFLTANEATNQQRNVNYLGIEAFPLDNEIVSGLQIPETIQNPPFHFSLLHEVPWDSEVALNQYLRFTKVHQKIEDFSTETKFHLVYFDAFAPEAQPELWTAEIFQKIASFLVDGAILTTYCSKVFVQQNLRRAGFQIQKHKGPPRKREVLRAIFEKK